MLQLPRLKPQDNFGGLLSSEKLKAFASTTDSRSDSCGFDEYEGELLTIKGLNTRSRDFDSQEHTIRPIPKKAVVKGTDASKSHLGANSSFGSLTPAGGSPAGKVGPASPPEPTSPSRPPLGSNFEPPRRIDAVYGEQIVDDYSDLFTDNDTIFDHKVNQAVQKVHHVGRRRLPLETVVC